MDLHILWCLEHDWYFGKTRYTWHKFRGLSSSRNEFHETSHSDKFWHEGVLISFWCISPNRWYWSIVIFTISATAKSVWDGISPNLICTRCWWKLYSRSSATVLYSFYSLFLVILMSVQPIKVSNTNIILIVMLI